MSLCVETALLMTVRSASARALAAVLITTAFVGCDASNASVDCAACASSAFDVIVVGSGAGGGPLAARLARAGQRVLLLEAGDDVGGALHYSVPAMHAISTEDPAMAWWFFVRHNADDAVDRTDSKWTSEGLLYPRGSALGGSTAVNAMVTVLPSPSDWDQLAALTGDRGFRAAAMAPYFDKVREWLPMELADPRLALGDSAVTEVLTAAATTTAEDGQERVDAAHAGAQLGSLLARDVNQSLKGGETTGLFRLPLATSNGRRRGTRERILDTVAEGYPLTVLTGAFVTQVLWDRSGPTPRAVGVEYVAQRGVYRASLNPQAPVAERKQAFAAREVVLSAGAFNTPQLLMLSGVGAPAALDAVGLPHVVERAGVGQNLQDRYEAPVVGELEAPVALLASCKLGQTETGDPCLEEWREGTGVYTTPGFLASVLRRSSSSPLADLQVFGVPTDARGYYPGYSRDSAAVKNRFTWLLLKAHTKNHDGTVTLKSADPFTRPEIRFNSYDERDPSHDPDLLSLVDGVKFVRRMHRAMVHESVREVWPGPAVASDAQLAAWIRKESWGHHACCTSKLGRADDSQAVIDSRFRVIGASGLRVVDASAFPEIPGTFIALPTFMLSERAADVMLEELR